MRKSNQTTSIRLTPEGRRLQGLLSGKLGVSKTAIIEIAIAFLADREQVGLLADLWREAQELRHENQHLAATIIAHCDVTTVERALGKDWQAKYATQSQ